MADPEYVRDGVTNSNNFIVDGGFKEKTVDLISIVNCNYCIDEDNENRCNEDSYDNNLDFDPVFPF